MVDAVKVIAAACESLRENGFYHSPRIIARKEFDLSKFDEQRSDIPGVEFEYVMQNGGGMTGDDFHGVIAWPIDELLFVCEY